LSEEAAIKSQVLLDTAFDFVRDHPLMSMGICVGVGYVLGYYKGKDLIHRAADAAAGIVLHEATGLIQQKFAK
jgi:hypothetical protein